MKSDLDEVFAQLDEEIENARLDCEEAENKLRVANAVFDKLMRVKIHVKNRVEKVRCASVELEQSIDTAPPS